MNTFKVISNCKRYENRGVKLHTEHIYLQTASPEGKYIAAITRCTADTVKQVGTACNLYGVNISRKKNTK